MRSPVPNPLFGTTSSSVSGTAVAECTCEGCGVEYVYFVTREVSAQVKNMMWEDRVSAEKNATVLAEAKLEKTLATAIDPVPCPACGLLQADMVRAAKWRVLTWVFGAAMAVAFVFVLSGFSAQKKHLDQLAERCFLAAGVIAVSGVVLSGLCYAIYNPNRRSAQLASNNRGIRKEVYDREQSQTGDDFLDSHQYPY